MSKNTVLSSVSYSEITFLFIAIFCFPRFKENELLKHIRHLSLNTSLCFLSSFYLDPVASVNEMKHIVCVCERIRTVDSTVQYSISVPVNITHLLE